MNSTIKTFLATAANRSGLLALLRRGAPTNVVFALHRVLPGQGSGRGYDQNLSIRTASFAAFLEFLASRFQVVSLDDFVTRAASGSANRMASITFDDGWIDNYQYAFPLLMKHRLPATIFLPTSLIGTNQRLPEERIVDIWDSAKSQDAIPELSAELHRAVGFEAHTLLQVRAAFKQVPLDTRLELLERLERRFDVSRDSRAFMTWDEVREMQRGGIVFGSHTSRHASLPQESDDVVERELYDSRQDLLRETGSLPAYFAYPNGRYDERVAKICERVGFKAAFTTQNTFVSNPKDVFTIPRVAIDDTVIGGPSADFSAARANLYLALAARASN